MMLLIWSRRSTYLDEDNVRTSFGHGNGHLLANTTRAAGNECSST